MRRSMWKCWSRPMVYSAALMALMIGAYSAADLANPSTAAAQDKGDPDLNAVEKQVQEAAKPAAAEANAKKEMKELEEESMLSFFFKALGWKYTIAFLALSFTFVALVVMNLLSARRESLLPVALVQGFETQLNEKHYQEAYDLAKNDESFLGQVLAAGLAKLSTGYAHAIEAMQEVGEEETMRLEHRLSYISLIASVSPMVGLLGTVDGMVQSFQVIAHSTVSPKPYELAQGIATALITTLVGLWLAIPAILIYGILRNRIQRLVLEVGVVSEQLMSRFENVQPKKP